MIRARRRPTPRTPRRPPVPKPSESSGRPAPDSKLITPPITPPPAAEAPSPFTPEHLVQLGNSLSLLDAKHPPRFMEIYQEQLALAIPRLSAEHCELVSPCLALSQLCNDPLRRAFLDRCAEVGAGQPIADIVNNEQTQAMPDIPSYHEETAKRR